MHTYLVHRMPNPTSQSPETPSAGQPSPGKRKVHRYGALPNSTVKATACNPQGIALCCNCKGPGWTNSHALLPSVRSSKLNIPTGQCVQQPMQSNGGFSYRTTRLSAPPFPTTQYNPLLHDCRGKCTGMQCESSRMQGIALCCNCKGPDEPTAMPFPEVRRSMSSQTNTALPAATHARPLGALQTAL
jgi:hypothetical protein